MAANDPGDAAGAPPPGATVATALGLVPVLRWLTRTAPTAPPATLPTTSPAGSMPPAQPGPFARSRRIGLVEALEDALQIFRGDTRTVIGNHQPRHLVTVIQPQLDPAALVRVLEGVIDQDPQQLLDRVGVALDRHRQTVEQLDATLRLQRLRLPGDVLHDGKQIDRRLVRVITGVGARERQQVLHHATHPLTLARDVIEGGEAVIRCDVLSLEQQADIATDG